MKRFIQFFTILLVVAAVAGCKNKENPSGDEAGILVKLVLPESSATPTKLCVYVSGTTYSKTVAAQEFSADHVLATRMELPVDAIPEDLDIPVYVVDVEGEAWSAELPLSANKTALTGSLALFSYVAGDGTQEKPYLIASSKQLKYMMDFYRKASQPSSKTSFKYWFRLLEDVDASSFSWTPLNNGGSFYKSIDFDGMGHTISGLKSQDLTYASFAGVLYGSVRNVTFDHATISHSNAKKGVVAGFLGTDGLPGSCENVHVINSTVSGGSYSGGFAGHIRTTGTIDNCSVEGTTVSSTNSHVGGFAGALDLGSGDKYEVPARLTGCSVKDVTVNEGLTSASDAVYVGGFIGASVQSGTYRGCTVKATVNAGTVSLGGVGGFVGGTSYAGSNFRNCVVESGTAVTAAGDRVGGFVGFAATADAYDKCESSATVSTSGNFIGGFAGFANGAAAFTECASSGKVTGAQYVGGFVGEADNASFRACSVKETQVAAQQYAGGFVGKASAAAFIFDYAVVTYNGSPVNAGSFVGQNPSAQASFAYCIGWHQTAPFCGEDPASSDFDHSYSGISGTVSSQAAESGWPASSWDFSGSYPVLKADARIINAIFVGDSITWQWGRNEGEYSKTKYPLKIDFNPAYMVDNGTTVTVKFHPGFFSRNGYIDKGISGQNTTQMKARFKKDVLDLNPVAVVLMGGTNDIAQGVSSDTIFGNISSMAASAKDAGIKVVICSITPNNRKYSVGYKSTFIEPLNVRFKELCDATEGYTYCDYWSSLVARTAEEAAVETDIMHGLKACYMLYDDLHPGPDGYDVMEPIVKSIIDALL